MQRLGIRQLEKIVDMNAHLTREGYENKEDLREALIWLWEHETRHCKLRWAKDCIPVEELIPDSRGLISEQMLLKNASTIHPALRVAAQRLVRKGQRYGPA